MIFLSGQLTFWLLTSSLLNKVSEDLPSVKDTRFCMLYHILLGWDFFHASVMVLDIWIIPIHL